MSATDREGLDVSPLRGIRAIAIDVLGTLVDEPSALRAALRAEMPERPDADITGWQAEWEEYASQVQRDIAAGRRPFVDADAIDAEASRHLVARARLEGAAAGSHLSRVRDLLVPWPDAVAGVAGLVERCPVFGLSNATARTLDGLAARAGWPWTAALSAERAAAYKPAPEVYRLVPEVAGVPADQVLMVAAHAWDLRGAAAAGMRTAYVARPGGDPPGEHDAFDGEYESLGDLAEALRG